MSWRSRIVGHDKVDPQTLTGHPLNHRLHPQKQREVVRDSIAQFGFVKSVLVNRQTGYIIDGHERVWQALDAQETNANVTVDVEYVDLSPEEERAVLAVLDASTEMAEVDQDKLAELLDGIAFESDAIDELIGTLKDDPRIEVVDDGDSVPEVPVEPVTKPGDLWLLGDHRLLCGDSTNADDVARLMGGKKATLVHADPPYGMGKEKDGIKNDNLYGENLDKFQMDWWRTFRPHIVDNASVYIWGNADALWRLWHVGGLRDSERLTFRNEIVWDKGHGLGMSSSDHRQFATATERALFFMLGEQGFNNNSDNYWEGWEPIRSYLESEMKRCGWKVADLNRITGTQMASHWVTRSQWSLITAEHYEKIKQAAREHDAFKREHDELKREHDELKREFYETRAYFDNTHDNMTDVWEFKRVAGEARHGHATPKPVEIVARVFKSSSQKNDIIVVPFGGSGPDFIAAEQLNRKCYGMEIAPEYCDIIVERWENLTGEKAICQPTT